MKMGGGKTVLELETNQPTAPLPKGFVEYVKQKSKPNGKGGRPHFLQEMAKTGDPMQRFLDVLEEVWVKNRPLRLVVKKLDVGYLTVWRVLQDIEPYKEAIYEHLTLVPRKKTFFNRELETSDYETVQRYINIAKRDDLKTWRRTLRLAKKAWIYLGRKDPTSWNSFEVAEFLKTQKASMRCKYLVSIRRVAPQISKGGSDPLSVVGYTDLEGARKKDIFAKEVNMIIKPLRIMGMKKHETIFKVHVAVAFREGSKRANSGISFCDWQHFKDGFTKVDDYETKGKGKEHLIIWRNCPTDLLFPDLPQLLREMWEAQGKPTKGRILGETKPYYHLLDIYKEIREVLAEHYKGKLDPHLYNELTTIRPHDSDKIHCNLLWEAEVPLEVLAGQYLGKGEGIGLVGRGWLSLDTIKKHYLSLTQRSQRFKKLRRQVQRFSQQFN